MSKEIKERNKGQRDKYKPYIRRMRGNEVGADWRTDIRVGFYADMMEKGWTPYVMVQRGFPNKAIMVGKSKIDIKRSILTVGAGRKTFNEWANDTKK